MFLACFCNHQYSRGKSCCSQSRPTDSTRDCYVTHKVRPRVFTSRKIIIRHASFSFIFFSFHVRCVDDITNYCVLFAYPSRRCGVIIVSINQPDVPYFTLYCCLCIAKLQTNRCDICIQYPSFSWNLRNRCIRFRYFVLHCMVLQYVSGAWKKNCLRSIEWKFITHDV